MINKFKKDDISNFISETLIYFKIELKHIKSFGVIATLFSMVIPLGVILMISMMPIQITKEIAVLYISGNLIASISNMCIVTLAQVLNSLRMNNGFEHIATLPIFTASQWWVYFLVFSLLHYQH